jgi:hypothetical protein
MPLRKGHSSEVVGENIRELLHSGHLSGRTKKKRQKQAIAIALREARTTRAGRRAHPFRRRRRRATHRRSR